MKKISRLTSRGNQAFVVLSMKFAVEASAMKTITVVALIFVPASFIAVSRLQVLISKRSVLSVTKDILICMVIGFSANGICYSSSNARAFRILNQRLMALHEHCHATNSSNHGGVPLL